MKILTVLATIGLTAILSTAANAYPAWSGREAYPSWQARPYALHHPWDRQFTRHRHIAHWRARRGHYGAIRQYSSGNLVARSGARASVSAHALPHFQCLVDRLEAAGYRIDFMGGFARRSNPSAHPTGNAVDINQTGFGRVTRRFPAGLEEMCRACGVYSGAHFSDYGHFEMPNKYGYVNIGRHYAYRHWRHRHYARAW